MMDRGARLCPCGAAWWASSRRSSSPRRGRRRRAGRRRAVGSRIASVFLRCGPRPPRAVFIRSGSLGGGRPSRQRRFRCPPRGARLSLRERLPGKPSMKQPNSSRQRAAVFRRERRKKKGAAPADAPAGANGDAKPPRPKKEIRRKYLREYVRWLWPYRWALLVVFALALVSATLDLVWPLAIKRIVDGVLLAANITNAEKLHRLNVFGGAIVVLLVLKEAVDTYRGYRTSVLNSKVVFRLRQKLFDRLLALPLGALGDMKSGG